MRYFSESLTRGSYVASQVSQDRLSGPKINPHSTSYSGSGVETRQCPSQPTAGQRLSPLNFPTQLCWQYIVGILSAIVSNTVGPESRHTELATPRHKESESSDEGRTPN
jgi:hypothetical protein